MSSNVGNMQRQVERISQSAVVIEAASSPNPFHDIRTILLNWLGEKAGRNLPDAMLRGETDRLDLLGAQRVETVMLADPLVWAARQDFQDLSVARRTWITEATIAEAPQRRILLGFRLHCVTMGDPSPFSRSIPRFVRTIAGKYNVSLDGHEIDPWAEAVETERDIEALLALLIDQNRKCPLVGISVDPLSGLPLIDPHKLASLVLGTAHVRLISEQAGFTLTRKFGRQYSAFNGAVRIWWPGFDPSRSDPYDHPLWLAERIREPGDSGILRSVVDRVLRASAGRRDADNATPSFGAVREIVLGLSVKNATGVGTPAQDMIKLYEEEIDGLRTSLDEAKAEQAAFVTLANEDLRQAIEGRDTARAELFATQSRIEKLLQALREREQRADVEIPADFDNLAAWAALNTGSLELLPRAINAAKKSMLENPGLAFRALLLLHEHYGPLKRTGVQRARDGWDEGLRQLGLECSPTFSGTRAGENPSDFYVSYNGRRREIDMHLKGSNSRDPRYCFRLYFFWDDEDQKVVVASLPSHLGTRAT